MAKIIEWTYTDEAPMLATFSLLPIMNAFTKSAGLRVKMADISVAGRVIAAFPEKLDKAQKQADHLGRLGKLAKTPRANIIKLPNISASIPQLVACIKELQEHGYDIPNYPENPQTDEEKDVAARYSKILGSAVNPVLREGNSDRRAAGPVKNYAKKFPHKMGPWSKDTKTHVSHMEKGDFFATEKSHIMEKDGEVKIEHVAKDGTTTTLKEGLKLEAGEVIDASFMDVAELAAFYEKEMADAKKKDVLLSLHLKATMMKVSDPILFGHCVKTYFKDVFTKHAKTLEKLQVQPNNGWQAVMDKIATLPEAERKPIEKDIDACYAKQPKLAMVNSDKGITNLHVPSDIIIDASMPAMIRGMDGLGGGMWCPDSKPGARDSHLCDTKALIPDRCYAGVFKETVEFCKKNGAFNVSTMGTVPNVGLMAKKAEEYGSHDKTFQAPSDGSIRVVDTDGNEIFSHAVRTGDVWRMCQTKDVAIKDWVKLAVTRARATGATTVFWLTKDRAHDRSIMSKVDTYLPEHDTKDLDIQTLPPVEACRLSLQRAKDGKDTISVTGNVLRDYNTDLFPILELGTSAKMLSIVPLLAGGGMYETGAGGSAPKHVEQFEKESHLRWDSLGEFLAFAVSVEEIGIKTNDEKVKALAATLNAAVAKFLDENKSPSRKKMEIDNRGSHFYLALYWAQELAKSSNEELKKEFEGVAARLTEDEAKIAQEMVDCQGEKADLGGYYHPDHKKVDALMRPSASFNAVIKELLAVRLERPKKEEKKATGDKPAVPEVGTRLRAKLASKKDDKMYAAEVIATRKPKKGPKGKMGTKIVRVHFHGYDDDQDAWVALDEIAMSKGRQNKAEKKAAVETGAKSGPAVPDVGKTVQALFAAEKKFYKAEVIQVGVKVHYTGYGADEDAWVSLKDLKELGAKAGKKGKQEKEEEKKEEKPKKKSKPRRPRKPKADKKAD